MNISRIILVIFLIFSPSLQSGQFENSLVNAAIDRTTHNVRYDGSYFSIAYPGGDVASDIGVCTDVIIRSYRTVGADLQVLVHEDMAENFDMYPSKKIWGLDSTDRNIDHRRVPNLQVFFERHGNTLKISNDKKDYVAGDIVTWMLPGNLPHVGIVTDRFSPTTGNPLIAHNIGVGPRLEDMLFSYKITGHYKFVPEGFAGH